MKKASKKHAKQLKLAANHYQSNRDYFDPNLLSPDDFFLASYPRSGNHYVRFTIFSALHFNETGKFPDGFSDLGKLPDIHRPDLDHEQVYQPRIIKTHYPFDPRYKKIIHLIRDPRDVVVSYYHYTYGSGAHYYQTPPGQPTIDEFVNHFLAGNVWPGKLRTHMRSYFNIANQPSIRYIQFYYENILKNPFEEFSRMFTFLSISMSPDNMKKLVSHTTFDNMSNLFKAESAQKGTGFTKKESITRKGGSGGHLDELSAESVMRFQQSFGDYESTLP